ncbi:hypothetical protein STAS_25467 [Striga asiatica]|uniref:Uncharacterized protein n=1 Tax=Striga asiatica TaxID=4170 RepID=A0A5A7QV46_STRAF|nr:hypothetical protein STAS_25467 [Striga asiatica]
MRRKLRKREGGPTANHATQLSPSTIPAIVSYNGRFSVSGSNNARAPPAIPQAPNTTNGTRSPSTTINGANMAPIWAAWVADPNAAFLTTVGKSSTTKPDYTERPTEPLGPDAQRLPPEPIQQERGQQVSRHLGHRVEEHVEVEVRPKVHDVEAQPVVHDRAKEVDAHSQEEPGARHARTDHGEGDVIRHGPPVVPGDAPHDICRLDDFAPDEAPTGGLGDEREDGEEEGEGWEGGGDVEGPPGRSEEGGDSGEGGDPAREEVESRHSSEAALGGAHGLGGEDERAEADAAGTEAGEEAEDGVNGVVRGEGREASEDSIEEANNREGAFSTEFGVGKVAENSGA